MDFYLVFILAFFSLVRAFQCTNSLCLCSLIAWNLIASYYDDLPYPGAGLMKANQPWSGYYEVGAAIWATGTSVNFPMLLSFLR